MINNTLILNPYTGELREITKIKKNDPVITTIINNVVPNCVEEISLNNIKPVYSLTLQTRKNIAVTEDYLFLTFPITRDKQNRRRQRVVNEIKWKSVNEINENDLVATPRKLPFFGDKTAPDDDLKLLGYMISDGHISIKHQPSFTNANKLLAQEFIEICEKKGWFVRQKPKSGHGQAVDYFIRNKKRYNAPNPFRFFINQYKLKVANAGEKEIPEFIFQLKKEKIALFLNRLFCGDGWCSFGQNWRQVHIGYSSKSIILMRQVQHLLLRFGIIATISEKIIKGNKYYSLEFGSKDYVLTFINDIGLLKAEHRYDKIKAIYDRTDERNPPFIRFNLFFEMVREIKYIGKLPTYNLIVPTTHNFIANDIIVYQSR